MFVKELIQVCVSTHFKHVLMYSTYYIARNATIINGIKYSFSKDTICEICNFVQFSNMYFTTRMVILFFVHQTFGVPYCEIDKSLQQICLRSDYLTLKPDDVSVLEVKTIVRILNVVEVDWKENTMTLFIDLMALWNDTRVFINET